MNEFLQRIADFAAGSSFWVYAFIFFGKIMEVTFGTLRIVLINRGEKTIGSLIAFVEITIWLIVASSVLNGFREDFLKGVFYALAFAAGNYIGSWLDELLAIGLSSVQVIISDCNRAKQVEEALRAQGFGVTSLDVHGKDDDHQLLQMTIKRKRLNEMVDWLESNCQDAVITVCDVKTQRGAYLNSNTKASPIRNGK